MCMCSLSKIVFLDAVLKAKFWIPVGQNVSGIYQKGPFINYVKTFSLERLETWKAIKSALNCVYSILGLLDTLASHKCLELDGVKGVSDGTC